MVKTASPSISTLQSGQSSTKEFFIALAVLIGLALVGYGFLLQPGQMPYSPHSDIMASGLANKTVLYESLQAGHGIPFWRSDELSGNAGLTNPLSIYTYPLHLLFFFLQPASAMGPTCWLHFLAAGIAMYLVGRSLGLGIWAQLYLATAGMFSVKLFLANYAGWMPNIPSTVCFPLLFACVLNTLRNPGLRALLYVTAVGTLCLHTGHLQLIYYSLLFLTAFVFAQAIAGWRSGKLPEFGKSLGVLAVGSLLALALTAYLLLPLAAETSMVSRGQASYEFFLGNHALSAKHFLTLLHPEALGTPLDNSYPGAELWEDQTYLGLLTLPLALLGMILGRRKPHTLFLSLSLLFALLLSMDTPLVKLCYELVPGFHVFRLPGRFMFLAAFFATALAGVGLNELLPRLRNKWNSALISRGLACLVILIAAGEGTTYAWRYLQMQPHAKVLPSFSRQDFSKDPDAVFRIAPLSRLSLNYGWAASADLQLITGFDSFNYRHYSDYCDLLQWGKMGPARARVWQDITSVTRTDLLDSLNVEYLVANQAPKNLPKQFTATKTLRQQPMFTLYHGLLPQDMHIYQNRLAMPRAYWAEQLLATASQEEMLQAVQANNLHQMSIVLRKDGQQLPDLPKPKPNFTPPPVQIKEAWGGHLRLQTQNPEPGFLVISEVWHPGWSASLNGEDLPLYQTNLALMGASIPAGKQELILRFRPLHWPWALSISALAGLVFLYLCWLCWLGWRKQRPRT